MMYLIGELAVWLLPTAIFAALAGWAFAAEQAAPAQARLSKDRDKLVGDLSTLASGEARSEGVITPDAESGRSLSAIRESRIAELERVAQDQRERADRLAAELAELQRRGARSDADTEELQRLRAQAAAHEDERARFLDAEVVAPAPAAVDEPDAAALQEWRLRYFEQRVKYLETAARGAPASTPAAAEHHPAAEAPVADWRARDAEARADFLAEELRKARTSTEPAEAPAASPFAANADVDVLLRWRMLYLERRAAHLQAARSDAPADFSPDPDKWKWRARYLESRVRHLEERTGAAQPTAATTATAAAAAEPPPPAVPGERPPGLPAAQSGAPDDFTLIDSISPLQQTTLYSLGIYHFDQIAAWTPANVAWVDRYLRLRGRIGDEEWLEQAADLAREGPDAARRQIEDESV